MLAFSGLEPFNHNLPGSFLDKMDNSAATMINIYINLLYNILSYLLRIKYDKTKISLSLH